MQSWVIRQGRKKTPQIPQYPAEEVATLPNSINMPPWGKLIRVPLYTSAVIMVSGSRPLVLPAGDHYLNYPQGSYQIRYVDLRQQRTHLAEIRGLTQDAWDVSLTLEVVWHVIRPDQVLSISGFLSHVTSSFQAAVRDYLRTVKHDNLVPVPGGQPVQTGQIVARLLQALQTSNAIQGIHILNILILDCQGDRRRTEVVQKATVDKTAIQEERQVTEQRLCMEKDMLERHRELELRRVEIDREKAEEEDRVRLKKAEYRDEEARLLRSARQQDIELEQQTEVLKMQHEQLLKSMEIRGQAVQSIANALVQVKNAQGLVRPMDFEDRDILMRAVGALTNGMPAMSQIVDTHLTLNPGSPAQNESLVERLSREMSEILLNPAASEVRIQPIETEGYKVTLQLGKIRIVIECGPGYPDITPRVSAAMPPYITSQKFNITWYNGLRLKDIVLQITSLMNSGSRSYTVNRDDDRGRDKATVAG
jgi:hypothetical protein